MTTDEAGISEEETLEEICYTCSTPIQSWIDEENKIGYLRINNFSNSKGSQIKNYVDKMEDCHSIIVDLRDNYGGNPKYPSNYLYSQLHNKTFTFDYEWYIPKTKGNKAVTKSFANIILKEP